MIQPSLTLGQNIALRLLHLRGCRWSRRELSLRRLMPENTAPAPAIPRGAGTGVLPTWTFTLSAVSPVPHDHVLIVPSVRPKSAYVVLE
jgi:hypothetical protein